jgi:hypothetical protein
MFFDAKYIVLLLGAAIVLAVVLELVTFACERPQLFVTSGNQTWYPELDRRVLLRLAATGGALAVLSVGIIAACSIDRDQASSLLEWPRHHASSLLLFGAAFYLIVLVCGVKPRQPVLLVCLVVPGLLLVPFMLAAEVFINEGIAAAIMTTVLVCMFQPAHWLLLFIGIGQARLLPTPGGDFTAGGVVRILLILVAYSFGFLI